MRGPDAMQESLFTVAKLDDFVPADHPLRAIQVLVNDALAAMNTRFNELYADTGRDSIAPAASSRTTGGAAATGAAGISAAGARLARVTGRSRMATA